MTAEVSMSLKDSRAAPSSAVKEELKNCDTPHNIIRKPTDLRIDVVLHSEYLFRQKAPITY